MKILYPYYVDIYNRKNYDSVRNILVKNDEFLYMMLFDNSINELSDINYIPFSRLNQNIQSLGRAFELEEDLAEKYFSSAFKMENLQNIL